MAVGIVFVTHATSLDNEAGLASGHFDVEPGVEVPTLGVAIDDCGPIVPRLRSHRHG